MAKKKKKRATALLPASQRHLVSRFSYGLTPGLGKQVHARGGAHDWFSWQLTPGRVKDRKAARLRAWWPHLWQSPTTLMSHHQDGSKPGWEVMDDYQRWVLARRITSQEQLLEVMAGFWENHFHVPPTGDAWFMYRIQYGLKIRKHALGRFDKLLHTVITHPAMLMYLDNAASTKTAPNENLGRELLELHTVGEGNYDEDDVKASARILTGWRVDLGKTWRPYYDKESHWVGRVRVLGFKNANKNADGRKLTKKYLTYLAHHPATAEHLARKLATKFVSDTPSKQLVKHLAKVYRKSDTDISAVLRALVQSKEFQRSRGRKITTPSEDVVATYRSLGVRLARPTSSSSAAQAILYQCTGLGAAPLGWPRPDGQPLTNRSWASPARLLGSLSVHTNMAGGWWPKEGISYREPVKWLPADEVRFDRLVRHLSEKLLHRKADKALLRACSTAVATPLDDVVDADHAVVKWQMPRLLTTLLDSPEFFTR
ncbi:DUF1800 domain-containing protein [Nocardioides sp.]|uniref:DUF1800 domain-containing protein n=1 Tax=Nocardioides sp. TaxID=35761 RepID=UPI0039E5A88F